MIEVVIDNNWNEDDKLKNFILTESDNGTLFHRPLFLQYHCVEKFPDTQRLKISFYENGELVGFVAGAAVCRDGEKSFISPFGSSYGGLVYHQNLSFKDIEDMFFLLLELMQKDYKHIKISTTPFFQSKTGKSHYIEHILLSKGFSVAKSDIVLVHELDTEEKLLERIHKKFLAQLKQPLYKKKLRLEKIAGVDKESYNLLLNAQERLQNKPTHTYDELVRIESLLPGTIQTFKAWSEENVLVSGIITFRVSDEILLNFYVFDSPEGRELKANHFVYYNVAKYAFQNNYKYLDFGPSSFGWLPNYPLIYFKEKFDGKPFLRYFFEKQN